MKKVVLILNQKKYDFTTDNQNRVKGQKISYINNDRLDMPNITGIVPFVVNVDSEIPTSLIPGLFEVEIYNMPSAKGQPIEILTNFKHIKNVDLTSIFDE